MASVLHSSKTTNPIAFSSKTLTDVETRYTNIHRGIASPSVLVLKSYMHTFYGRCTTVQNDHKLLEMIHKNPYMQHHQDYNACYSDYKNMATQFNTLQMSWQTDYQDFYLIKTTHQLNSSKYSTHSF